MGSDVEPCQLLAWDSDWWGVMTASVALRPFTESAAEEVDRWCRARNVELLYLLVPADDPGGSRIAEGAGYRLVDTRVALGLDIVDRKPAVRAIPGVAVRHALEGDIPPLGDMASRGFLSTRFYADPRLPDARCGELYREWIQKECRGGADAVLVAEKGGRPVAYISCHVDHGTAVGRIGLVGVDESSRGRGIGSWLMDRAVDWFTQEHVQRVEVVTQVRNVVAQRLYQRKGFLTDGVGLWFHKWFS